MSEVQPSFDPGPEYRDDVRRARARVTAMTPAAAKAMLLELVETFPSLVLTPEERGSCLIAFRGDPDEPLLYADGTWLVGHRPPYARSDRLAQFDIDNGTNPAEPERRPQ